MLTASAAAVIIVVLTYAFVFVEVLVRSEPHHFLLDQVSIWHRFSDGNNTVSLLFEVLDNELGKLALPAAGSDRTHANDRN